MIYWTIMIGKSDKTANSLTQNHHKDHLDKFIEPRRKHLAATASELDNNINVQFKQDQLHFLAGVGIQRYQDTHKVERPKMISITNEKTLEEESVRVESQMIRNDTDEKAVRKESVESKRQGIRSPTDEKTLRKDSVESKVLRNATDEKALRKESV